MYNQVKEQSWLKNIRGREELANARKINEWLLPLLNSDLVNKPLTNIALLSVGCGFGVDIDCLVDAGVDAYGVEPFARTKMWDARKYKERLIVSDGRDMPFNDNSFDVIYCTEVLEHVGDEQLKAPPADIMWKEREQFARELTRVLRPQGIIIITTPNRHFCVDIGHGRNFLGVRVHSPFSDFTLSMNDIKTLFLQVSGCREISTLPYKNFITWDIYVQNYPIVRFLSFLIRAYINTLDRFSFLRSTLFSPHLILIIKK